jgi:hypothetical protein
MGNEAPPDYRVFVVRYCLELSDQALRSGTTERGSFRRHAGAHLSHKAPPGKWDFSTLRGFPKSLLDFASIQHHKAPPWDCFCPVRGLLSPTRQHHLPRSCLALVRGKVLGSPSFKEKPGAIPSSHTVLEALPSFPYVGIQYSSPTRPSELQLQTPLDTTDLIHSLGPSCPTLRSTTIDASC